MCQSLSFRFLSSIEQNAHNLNKNHSLLNMLQPSKVFVGTDFGQKNYDVDLIRLVTMQQNSQTVYVNW